jgi:hypothetical protein
VPAFTVLVLKLELLVAIHPVAKVSSPFLDMSSVVVSLAIPMAIGTSFLWTCVAIINFPDSRNNLSELLADTCIELNRVG